MAAESGVRQIRWGQTSPDAKGRMGAVLEPLWFAIRFRNSLVSRVVRMVGPALFPERGQIQRRVLQEPADRGEVGSDG